MSDIQHLRVAHWPKSPEFHGMPAPLTADFVIDTCLRQISIGLMPESAFRTWRPRLQHENPLPRPEVRSGADAYQFLLEVTTGLRSAIPGETNVFGQFKKSWRLYRCTGQGNSVARLAPVIHRLINDTKAVRQQHLEGIGGASYGSLVRKLITPNPGDRILFVGCGGLTQSMLPLFRTYELGIWNRRTVEALTDSVEHIFQPDQGQLAAIWANHVILTTPADKSNDSSWLKWLSITRKHSVVHLGNRSFPGQMQRRDPDNFVSSYNLDDVFALRREQNALRSDQLRLALSACRRFAKTFTMTGPFAVKSNANAKDPKVGNSTLDTRLALA